MISLLSVFFGCGEYHGKLKKILEKWIGYMEFRMNSGILGVMIPSGSIRFY